MSRTLSFLAGAVVGAVGGLLLSPNSGERNREIIADKLDYVTAQGEQVFQQTADNVLGAVRGVTEPETPSSDDIRAKINEARNRIAEQITRNSAQDIEADVADVAEPAPVEEPAEAPAEAPAAEEEAEA